MDGTIYDNELTRIKHEAIQIEKLEELDNNNSSKNLQSFTRKRKIAFLNEGYMN